MKFSTITLLYLIMLDSLIFYSFSIRQNEVLYEFEQRQQDIQVNYAVDAATQLMLSNTNDIYLDYQNMEKIYVDPQVALDTYNGLMVRYYGWSDESLTRQYFEDMYMPFFIVAAYDGYYVYSVTQKTEDTELNDGTHVENRVYPKTWSPKIPYAEGEWNGDSSVIHMYNLGGEVYSAYMYQDDKYYDNIAYISGTGFGSRANASKVVANALTEACNKALISGKAKIGETQIIIPNSFSEWSKNRPVEYPTVLTYLDTNASNTGNFSTPTFAIGGSQIDIANYYICYVDDGVKKYTWAVNREAVEAEGITIDKVYMSAYDCADDGYYFDLNYLE